MILEIKWILDSVASGIPETDTETDRYTIQPKWKTELEFEVSSWCSVRMVVDKWHGSPNTEEDLQGLEMRQRWKQHLLRYSVKWWKYHLNDPGSTWMWTSWGTEAMRARRSLSSWDCRKSFSKTELTSPLAFTVETFEGVKHYNVELGILTNCFVFPWTWQQKSARSNMTSQL